MVVPVNPISPVIAVPGLQGDVGFRAGSTVSARVVKLLPDNQVRIAIGTMSIDVSSEVPLQPGQTLRLAVSQTADGVRLAVVPSPTTATPQTGLPMDNVTLAPEAQLTLANVLSTAKVTLTAPETVAVSTAAQIAATQQASLATLFANLGDGAALQTLPLPLQQAVANLLAQRPPLDANLTGGEVKAAFQYSGLFLEASLASGIAPSTNMPDMKAALIVFRQVLSGALGGDVETQGAASFVATSAPAFSSPPVVNMPAAAQPAAAVTLAPSIMPEMLAQDDLLQQAGLFAAEDFADFTSKPPINAPAASSPEAAARVAASGTTLSLLQEALQTPNLAGNGVDAALDEAALLNLISPKGKPLSAPDDALLRNNVPPPPVRGALPSAQPMPLSMLPPNAPLSTTLHHLLADTDAAIARQTLLQVASLPDRMDASAPRLDATQPRWNFEIPFAMPHGTAVAQFEISRDGGGDTEAEAAARVWRARFSLDVEPAGPVHALVSLAGDKTSVRIWAERPVTAQQLRADSPQLSQALVRAELTPGDIVIQDGAPVQAAPASAGHFLDRAL